MQRREKIVLQKICSEIDLALKFIGNKNLEEFLKNNLMKMAILRGIDLLELDKPKKFKNLSTFKNSNDDAEN